MTINLHPLTRKRLKTVLALLGLGMALGVAAIFLYPDLLDDILAGFTDRFGTDPELDMDLAVAIFRQNMTVSILAWLGGIVLGLMPMAIVLANGFILTYITGNILDRSGSIGDGAVILALGLVPHGIIEIPAFLAAATIGLRLGWDWLAAQNAGRRLPALWETFKATARTFVFITGALAAAAVIEVFVSGRIVNNL